MDVKIAYAAPPTVARYMSSTRRMRVIKGPAGCLPADSEFLSPQGWVRMDAWDGHEVACWAPETRAAEFLPVEYVKLPGNEFIRFEQKSLCMELTPEHTVPHYKWDGAFATCTAERIEQKPSTREIPVSFGFNGPGAGFTDDEVLFLIALSADGHIIRAEGASKGRREGLAALNFTFRKDRKKARFAEIINRLGYDYERREYAGRPTETQFAVWVPPRLARKDLQWVYQCSQAQLRLILDECTFWDGRRTNGEQMYYSGVKANADAIQFVAHACGRRASLKQITYPGKDWNCSYNVQISNEGSFKSRCKIRGDHMKIERFPGSDGFKYCFTTPTGYFVARCKGRVFVTGNSGKSSGSVMLCLKHMMEQEPDWDGQRRSRWAIVRRTMPQLRTTTIKTFLDWIPPGTLGEWKESIKEYHFRFNDVEAEVMFLALDTPDDVQKLLSLELSGCYFNEFREIDPEIYEGMTTRVGRYPSKKGGPGPTWYGIWADTNPPRVGSWHHRQMENLDENLDPLPERTDEWAWDVFHQPSGRAEDAENLENLPEGYYSAEGRSPEFVKTMIDGEYGPSLDGLPVFRATFKSIEHVAEQPLLYVDRAPMVCGLDAGLTPAIVFAQELPSGKVNIIGNVALAKGETMGMERFLRDRVLPYMRAHFPGLSPQNCQVSADPACWQRSQANEVTVAEIISRFRFNVRKAPTNDLEPRLSAVESLLQRRVGSESGLRIDKRCRALINALEFGYVFKKKKDGNAQDQPEKNEHSHVSDACQYLALALGGAAYDLNARRSQARPVVKAPRRAW